jgi:Fe-S cluster biogenesis protein NfuA/nitrite reductase/ring-hydroxylating ferredoxin subunit
MPVEDDRQSLREPRAMSLRAARAHAEAPVESSRRADSSIVQLRVPGRPGRGQGGERPEAPGPAQGSISAAPAALPAPHETPLATLLRDVEALHGLVGSWGDRERNTVMALERAIDALHKEALSRLIRALKASPAAAAALREAASDEVVYAVLRHHEILRASLHERVEAALESVRPLLASHGGNVELVGIEAPAVVTVRLLGSCDGCSAAGLTLRAGVEKAIQEQCPEVKQIKLAAGGLASQGSSVHSVSPFAAQADDRWARAALLEEIPDEGVLAVELLGHSLLLFRSGSRVSCFENACAHLGMPLDDGEVKDGVLTCARHGFQFLLESGECLTVPEVQLQTHAARVSDASVEVRFS